MGGAHVTSGIPDQISLFYTFFISVGSKCRILPTQKKTMYSSLPRDILTESLKGITPPPPTHTHTTSKSLGMYMSLFSRALVFVCVCISISHNINFPQKLVFNLIKRNVVINPLYFLKYMKITFAYFLYKNSTMFISLYQRGHTVFLRGAALSFWRSRTITCASNHFGGAVLSS